MSSPSSGFSNPGSPITKRVTFNQGTIDFGNSRLVDVDNIALSIEYTMADLFILGSIFAADKVRHSQKISMTGKIKSYPAEMQMWALGSSVIATQNQANTVDGQPTFLNPVFTAYDRNNKEIQYQLLNAIFKSTKLTAKAEDYAEWDFELEAIDIVEIYTP
jgi:hypothetical protein